VNVILPAVGTTWINPLGVPEAVHPIIDVVVASASACTNDTPAIAAVVQTLANIPYAGIVPSDCNTLFAVPNGNLSSAFNAFLMSISPGVVSGSVSCFAFNAFCKSTCVESVPVIVPQAAPAREPHTTVKTALPSIAHVNVIVTLSASTIVNVSGTIASLVASNIANTKSVVLRL
jgi:hypothetical protein